MRGAYRDGLPARSGCSRSAIDTPCVYHLFPMRDRATATPRRAHLAARGIETGVHYSAGRTPAPRAGRASSGGHASTCRLRRHGPREELSLPMFPELREREIECVLDACADLPDAAVEPIEQDGAA